MFLITIQLLIIGLALGDFPADPRHEDSETHVVFLRTLLFEWPFYALAVWALFGERGAPPGPAPFHTVSPRALESGSEDRDAQRRHQQQQRSVPRPTGAWAIACDVLRLHEVILPAGSILGSAVDWEHNPSFSTSSGLVSPESEKSITELTERPSRLSNFAARGLKSEKVSV